MSSVTARIRSLIILTIIACIFIIGSPHIDFFKLLFDLMTIIIMALVYVLAVKCYRYTKNDYSLFMGYSSLTIGIVRLIQILLDYSEHGFSVSVGAIANLGTLLSETFFFGCAPFLICRKFSKVLFISGVMSILILDIALVWHSGDLSDYGNILGFSCGVVLLLAIVNLFFQRRKMDDSIYHRVMGAMILLTGALFLQVVALTNTLKLIPALFRLGAYLLIYKGMISIPYELVIRNFKEKALIDDLTGLYNRQGLMEFAKRELARADREGWYIGVLLMDLDRFKIINDRHGHLAGDRIIQQFANILKASIRETDIICRLGGDEFVVMLSAKEVHPSMIKDRIIEAVEYWKSNNQLAAKIGVSIGIGIKEPGSPKGLEEILKEADQHMYCDKNKKKPVKKNEAVNQYKMFG